MLDIIDRLNAIEVPDTFSRQRMWELFAQETLGRLQKPVPFVEELMDILGSDELGGLIAEGKITLAIVKPKLDSSIDPEAVGDAPEIAFDDPSLTEFLLRQIKPPLELVFQASLIMNTGMVDKFYSDEPKQKMQMLPPEFIDRYPHAKNRWDEHTAYMTSGPVTFALLFSPDGQAVDHWRIQMGNDWNVDRLKQIHSNSLRAKAQDRDRNLLHGSDGPQSVRREIGLLVEFLNAYTEIPTSG